MSLRDTLLQLGYLLIGGGAIFATWVVLTGPLARWIRADITHEPADDPRIGSSEEPT